MDDSILRGFCKKCETPLIFGETKCVANGVPSCYNNMPLHPSEPVWFLSARQMKIIDDNIINEVWHKYTEQNDDGEHYFSLIKLLTENPFLVAKILREEVKKE